VCVCGGGGGGGVKLETPDQQLAATRRYCALRGPPLLVKISIAHEIRMDALVSF
jgi:hypothetical protein